MKRTLQELTIKDAFMFAAVMSDSNRCRDFLSMVLCMEILDVTVITEKTLKYHPEYHGIRLDVLAEEKGTKRRFNVEMQVKDLKNIALRSRYYHSQMDIDLLAAGEPYDALPATYVIFICDYDPLGKGLYLYTNETVCRETGDVIEDGVGTIWLSTKGKNVQGVPPELVSFLKYVENPENAGMDAESSFVRSVQEDVDAIKKDHNWEAVHAIKRAESP